MSSPQTSPEKRQALKAKGKAPQRQQELGLFYITGDPGLHDWEEQHGMWKELEQQAGGRVLALTWH